MDIKKLIKNGNRIIPRLNLETKKYTRLHRYRIEKSVGYDPLTAAKMWLHIRYRKLPGTNIKNKILAGMKSVLLCADIDTVFNTRNLDNAFVSSLRTVADKAVSNDFYILHEYRDNVFDGNDNKYKWYYDFDTGYEYKKTQYYEVRKKNTQDGVDIKNLWELSRMQYLFAPALMWRLSGESKYAEFIIKVISNWINENRFEEGPNWNIAMETGIRAINMILAFQLISNYDSISESFCEEFVACIYLHLKFISRNEENYLGNTYNHYLGGLLGILSISTTFPFLPKAYKFKEYAIVSFEREIRRQILGDGGSFEGSTCYHGLVCEMFSLAALICRHAGIQLKEEYYDRLDRTINFSCAIQKQNREMPQIGDNDGGRILQLLPDKPLFYKFYPNLAKWLTSGKLIALDMADELLCFIGNVEPSKDDVEIAGSDRIIFFPDSKLVLYKDENLYCMMCATEAQKYGMGGHTHNDKLSIELSYRGKDFFVDPGSGSYTANAKIHSEFRSVKAHSTVCIDKQEQNSSQINAFFGNSYEAKTDIIINKNSVEHFIIEGKASIRHADFQYVHKRMLEISNYNRIRIIDRIDTLIGRIIDWRFVLHPDVSVELFENEAILTHDDVNIKITAPFSIWLENGLYSSRYNEWKDTNIICFRGYLEDIERAYITEITI